MLKKNYIFTILVVSLLTSVASNIRGMESRKSAAALVEPDTLNALKSTISSSLMKIPNETERIKAIREMERLFDIPSIVPVAAYMKQYLRNFIINNEINYGDSDDVEERIQDFIRDVLDKYNKSK